MPRARTAQAPAGPRTTPRVGTSERRSAPTGCRALCTPPPYLRPPASPRSDSERRSSQTGGDRPCLPRLRLPAAEQTPAPPAAARESQGTVRLADARLTAIRLLPGETHRQQSWLSGRPLARFPAAPTSGGRAAPPGASVQAPCECSLLSSHSNQSLASRQSRKTVSGETFNASAVSFTLSPPKKRSSTTRLLR